MECELNYRWYRKLVAIPDENIENVRDFMVKSGTESLWQVQIFSVPDLQSLIQFARTDRPEDLTEAISQFAELQEKLQIEGEELLS